MGINNEVTDKTGETAADSQGSGKSTGFDSAKNTIADKLHGFAEAIGKKTADAHSGMVSIGERASELLDQSAEYVRQFDYHHTDARIREYIRQSPGRSLLMAGAVGLIIGVILKRR
jgi:ElaB/YqjD/DUF883 family membrane-anchored ribosome-binding protein